MYKKTRKSRRGGGGGGGGCEWGEPGNEANEVITFA